MAGYLLQFGLALSLHCCSCHLVLLHLMKQVLLAGALELHTLLLLNVVLLTDVGHDAHRMAHCERVIAYKTHDSLSHIIAYASRCSRRITHSMVNIVANNHIKTAFRRTVKAAS